MYSQSVYLTNQGPGEGDFIKWLVVARPSIHSMLIKHFPEKDNIILSLWFVFVFMPQVHLIMESHYKLYVFDKTESHVNLL